MNEPRPPSPAGPRRASGRTPQLTGNGFKHGLQTMFRHSRQSADPHYPRGRGADRQADDDGRQQGLRIGVRKADAPAWNIPWIMSTRSIPHDEVVGAERRPRDDRANGPDVPLRHRDHYATDLLRSGFKFQPIPMSSMLGFRGESIKIRRTLIPPFPPDRSAGKANKQGRTVVALHQARL